MRNLLLPAGVAAALLGPGAAVAAPTQTHITQPAASPTFPIFQASAGTTLPVAGTSNGGTAPLDLRCDYGTTRHVVHKSIGPNANGTWSYTIPASELSPLAGRACTLRAVPHGSNTTSAAFAPVAIAVGRLQLSTVSGGPNNGALYDYSVWATQLGSRGVYSSIGGCGLGSTSVFQLPTFFPSTGEFACAGRLPVSTGARAGVQVGCGNAWAPAGAAALFGPQTPSVLSTGLRPLTYTATVDPATGNLPLREQEALLRCGPAPTVFSPTAATCASVAPDGA